MEILEHTLKESDPKGRCDKVLKELFSYFSRSRIQSLLEQGHVLINNFIKPASYKLKTNDHIIITIPPLEEAIPQPVSMDLSILYEDSDVLVINKPAGLVVHPAPGHYQDTLVNGLLSHCVEDLSGIGGVKRPGIVHRLDKDTSGLMVVAKNDKAHQHLSDQFQVRSLTREYYAYVFGTPFPTSGQIDKPIGRCLKNRQKMAVIPSGKPAITNYKLLKTFANNQASLILCKLETGRTHQIRVHLTDIDHPLIGDPLYKKNPKKEWKKNLPEQVFSFPRQALHAFKLSFIHPKTTETLTFTCDLPDDLIQLEASLDQVTTSH